MGWGSVGRGVQRRVGSVRHGCRGRREGRGMTTLRAYVGAKTVPPCGTTKRERFLPPRDLGGGNGEQAAHAHEAHMWRRGGTATTERLRGRPEGSWGDCSGAARPQRERPKGSREGGLEATIFRLCRATSGGCCGGASAACGWSGPCRTRRRPRRCSCRRRRRRASAPRTRTQEGGGVYLKHLEGRVDARGAAQRTPSANGPCPST